MYDVWRGMGMVTQEAETGHSTGTLRITGALQLTEAEVPSRDELKRKAQ